MATLRPRTAVIADAWTAAEIDAPALVNKKGLPLARTQKCLLDPLVFRPRERKHLAKALLNPADAAEMYQLLVDSREALSWTSLWYLEFKEMRQALGISEGNPQELYYPRAYELAITRGAPEGDVSELVSALLDSIHTIGPSTREVMEVLRSKETHDYAEKTWTSSWYNRRVPPQTHGLSERLALALLDQSGERLEAFVATEDVRAIAFEMRDQEGIIEKFLEAIVPKTQTVSLSEKDPLVPPELLGSAFLPLDRTIEQRVRAALIRHRDADSEVGAAEIVIEEIERAVDAFGLHDARSQALFLVGTVIAPQLTPLLHVDSDDGGAAEGFVGELQQRIRREAYVMHLRRQLCAGGAIHPDQTKVVADLQDFWKPWLNRLWSRLHGREIRPRPPAESPKELLTGITRSVILDHRARIRKSLERSS